MLFDIIDLSTQPSMHRNWIEGLEWRSVVRNSGGFDGCKPAATYSRSQQALSEKLLFIVAWKTTIRQIFAKLQWAITQTLVTKTCGLWCLVNSKLQAAPFVSGLSFKKSVTLKSRAVTSLSIGQCLLIQRIQLLCHPAASLPVLSSQTCLLFFRVPMILSTKSK